jgi:hypothetical protein
MRAASNAHLVQIRIFRRCAVRRLEDSVSAAAQLLLPRGAVTITPPASRRNSVAPKSTPGVIDVASGSNADAADLGGESVAEEAVTGGIAKVGGEAGGGGGLSPEVVSVEVQGGNDIEILERG